jgi:aryl-alcohol dehydrogenase-like predicted oxidoreductase
MVMRYTVLGTSNDKIPVVGLGMGKGIGNQAKTAGYDVEDERCIRLGVELGMTFIDVAHDYGRGQAEEAVGRAIKGIREKVFIATKFPPEKSSGKAVMAAAEESLKRLKTDRIDLFQTHWPNPQIPLEETLKAMEKLVDDGKVRYIGLSNCTIGEAKRARSSLLHAPLASVQQEYNLLDRTAEAHFMPFCREIGMTFIGYSPLAHLNLDRKDARLTKLEEIAGKNSLSPTQLVLAWLTRHKGTMVVMRTSSAHHLEENAQTGDLKMSPEDMNAISSIFASEVRSIPASLMWVRDASKVYTTLEGACRNAYNLTPSPAELAEQIRSGEILKPIKICACPHTEGHRQYEVVEGKLRYWAWVLAYGKDVVIPSIVKETGDIR